MFAHLAILVVVEDPRRQNYYNIAFSKAYPIPGDLVCFVPYRTIVHPAHQHLLFSKSI